METVIFFKCLFTTLRADKNTTYRELYCIFREAKGRNKGATFSTVYQRYTSTWSIAEGIVTREPFCFPRASVSLYPILYTHTKKREFFFCFFSLSVFFKNRSKKYLDPTKAPPSTHTHPTPFVPLSSIDTHSRQSSMSLFQDESDPSDSSS